VESGCIYCALQLVVLITIAITFLNDGSFVTFFQPLIVDFYVQTTAMYPMAVLLLIQQKRSVVDIHVARITASRNQGNV